MLYKYKQSWKVFTADSLKDMKELTLTRHTVYVSTVEKPSFVGVAFTNIVNNVGKSSYT
jgi:hypothetical protein